MKKIGQKEQGQGIPKIIEKYTVGNDYILDKKIRTMSENSYQFQF